MLSLGLCNILGSFVQSMPTTGSFTRTAVNNASGVRTTFGGIFTGVMVLLALGFLTASFQYIPKSTLAAVIVYATAGMVDTREIAEIWRCKRIDIIPFIATLLACLTLSLEFGILVGILINLMFILHRTARPIIHTVSKIVIAFHESWIEIGLTLLPRFRFMTVKYYFCRPTRVSLFLQPITSNTKRWSM